MTTAVQIQPATSRGTGAWLWISNGVFWFLLCLYVWGAWILGPDFKENAIGRELASSNYVLWVRFVEVASILLAIFQIWIFILKPKIRTGRLSFDGIFFLACWTLYLQEPCLNYNGFQFNYTTVSYNVGSWLNYIPGWNSPNAELIPVGSIIWCMAYLNLVAFWAYSGSRFMTWLKSKKPQLSAVELILITFVVFIPFDLVLESIILRSELFNYMSTVPELTLWAGEKHQFPFYEIVSWCGLLTAWSAVHHFRNDKGETFAERGLCHIRFPSEGIKTFTRFLVVMGLCQMLFLLMYNIPYFYWSTKGGAIPEGFAEYRIGGVCGPETNFDCPSEQVPLAKRASPTNRIIPIDQLPKPIRQ